MQCLGDCEDRNLTFPKKSTWTLWWNGTRVVPLVFLDKAVIFRVELW